VRRPRDESRGVIRERTRYGCTFIVQVAEVGRTHRAQCSPGGRKACWRTRALARRKHVAPPDAEHGPREGETVRGTALTIKSTRWFGLRVSARSLSIRRKTFSGFRPARPYGRVDVRSFGAKVNLSFMHDGVSRKGAASGREADSASVGTEAGRACLRATVRTSEVDAIR